jgi:hypothetical protein
MSNDPVIIPFPRANPPGILASAPLARQRPADPVNRRPASRYVTQSHPVSAPMANPTAIVIAAVIAIGLYFLGRRLSGD